ncbi:twin-arginine translocase subunit TatC [Halorhabdus amylolytica]|uniref:twin-arginine translocase subunit TatC n=1 Tax=Halorhabdus amylolytica TaxID=2559573 RepID=UPI0010A9D811|nr:twin-arginine translocase subunit TatC [Halorhabdus amylolytica]
MTDGDGSGNGDGGSDPPREGSEGADEPGDGVADEPTDTNTDTGEERTEPDDRDPDRPADSNEERPEAFESDEQRESGDERTVQDDSEGATRDDGQNSTEDHRSEGDGGRAAEDDDGETDEEGGDGEAGDGREEGSDDADEKSTRKNAPRRETGPSLVPDAEGPSEEGAASAEGRAYRGPPEGEAPVGESPSLEEAGEHAPDDEEMPLADHVEEMVRRLGVVLVLMAGVSAVIFPFGEQIINVIWYSFLPGTYELCPTTSQIPTDPVGVITAAMVDVGAGPGVTMAEGATIKPACPRVYQPLATIFARFKVATLAGFVIALPAFVYETYLFMRPGLYPRERRYYLAAVPTSLILATVGIAFAYLLVLPAIFTYFLYYSEGAADIAFGLTQTFDLMVLMMGFFAAIFQIPLFIMLAIMMGVTSRQWLADRRLLFWAAFAGIAFIFNPDPTGMAPFIIAATMIALFEGTLLLLSWTGSEGLLPSPDAVAAHRPYVWVLAGVAGYLASDTPVPEGYYEQLPGLLRGFIEGNDLVGMTPLVVGGVLIAVYELAVFVLRRYLPVGAWRRKLFSGRVSLFRVRTPVWIVSLVIGYLASPNPFLLDRAGTVGLEPIEAAALTVGLIVTFEVALVVWRYLRPDEDEQLPLER